MQEKWTKLRANVLSRTNDLADAAVLSFIMDGAEIQKTDSPIIAKSFISESLNLGDWQTQNSIGRLLDEGWFTSVEHVQFEKFEGVKVPSTKFNLSGRCIGVGEGLWRRFGKKETVQIIKNQANEVH
jgi:hypothetical protein